MHLPHQLFPSPGQAKGFNRSSTLPSLPDLPTDYITNHGSCSHSYCLPRACGNFAKKINNLEIRLCEQTTCRGNNHIKQRPTKQQTKGSTWKCGSNTSYNEKKYFDNWKTCTKLRRNGNKKTEIHQGIKVLRFL